ncbi:MAG: MerR family transcriptional regulator, partial [Alphaproteobacteria bacterium]
MSRATLYAYVSRGLIRSEAGTGARRRLYRADDVKRLRDRKAPGREPAGARPEALAWGAPVLDSAITLIAEGRLFYRGRDACELAATATIETVAAILWD